MIEITPDTQWVMFFEGDKRRAFTGDRNTAIAVLSILTSFNVIPQSVYYTNDNYETCIEWLVSDNLNPEGIYEFMKTIKAIKK